MLNAELAEAFDTLADILELQGENVFKVNAYRKAARALRDLDEDFAKLAKEERLREVPGIGAHIAEKIAQYIATGKIEALEKARATIPDGLLALMKIPGLGPRTAALVYEKLKISTLDDLLKAANSGELAGLPRMGEKRVSALLKSIEFMGKATSAIMLGNAMPLAERIIEALRVAVPNAKVEYAGSLRRMKETVADVDILAASDDNAKLVETFTTLPYVQRILAAGETKATVIIEHIQVDLRVVPRESFGAAMQYFTGSKPHNIRLRSIAIKRGLKLSEYGLFKGKDMVAGATEEDVYAALGLPWISPALREDRGEIDAAIEGKLPKLVELSDIIGDYHVHTDWSDGHNSIEEMAAAAKKRGYKRIVITDHTPALKVFGGLSMEELAKQIAEVKAISKKLRGIKLLTGAEVDIHADGNLDLPDAALAKLDFVIASVHSGFRQDRAKMTARIIRAIEHPHVKAIGHLTGRLIGKREPYDVDIEAVLAAAAHHGKALELNANPMRLDINDHICRRAKELGVKVVINTDAHHIEDYDLMKFGIATAQRGWLEKSDVLNAE